MIGVLCNERERAAAAEFFELFKTPWEFYQAGRQYDVVLADNLDIGVAVARLVIVFASDPIKIDHGIKTMNCTDRSGRILRYGNWEYPIHGRLLGFSAKQGNFIKIENSELAAGVEISAGHPRILRIGYDLFDEVNTILASGQSANFAAFPTIDLHIKLLRNWISEAGLPLVEIPPVPYPHKFFVCLTHDVDFAGIRNHLFDHTLWGFIYRATLGSVLRLLKKKMKLRNVLRNWMAVISLPLVFIGLKKTVYFFQIV